MSVGNICKAVPMSVFWAPQLTQLIYWKCFGISIQHAWQISNGIFNRQIIAHNVNISPSKLVMQRTLCQISPLNISPQRLIPGNCPQIQSKTKKKWYSNTKRQREGYS